LAIESTKGPCAKRIAAVLAGNVLAAHADVEQHSADDIQLV
jgi:hypothetical protein